MTAKHIQSLGPSSCSSSWEKSKPSEWVQQQAPLLCLQHVLYFMILKSQIKQKTVGALVPILLLPPSLPPFPKTLTPAGIGPQNKELNWGKNELHSRIPSCISAQQLSKEENQLEKSQKALLLLKCRGAQTPWGEVRFGVTGGGRARERQRKGTLGTGGGQNKDIPLRGSCGSTSTEAPPMGYTQVLDSQTKMTHLWAVHVTKVSINQGWLLHM